MKKFIVLLFLFPVLVNGQDFPKEISFVKNLDLIKWNKIVARATKEDKIIYIQYAFIENNSESLKRLKATYNDDKVLDYLNKHFICFFIPFEEFENRSIDFLPANPFLDSLMPVPANGEGVPSNFFSKQGKKLHKKYALTTNASRFLEELEDVVNEKNNYYQLIEEFNNGNRDIEFFKHLLPAVSKVNESVDNYVKTFVQTRDDLFTKENAELLMHCYSQNVAFDYLYNNQNTWKKVISEDTLENFYKKEIYKEICIKYYNPIPISPYDLVKLFEEKYPKYGRYESIKFLLVQELKYLNTKNKINYDFIINTYVDSFFLSKATPTDLNSCAWSAFLNITDKTLLNKALFWSKKSLEQDKDNPAYLDTYANLLYKLGLTKEAIEIEIETKALDLVEDSKKKSYQEVSDKMKNGEPPWK